MPPDAAADKRCTISARNLAKSPRLRHAGRIPPCENVCHAGQTAKTIPATAELALPPRQRRLVAARAAQIRLFGRHSSLRPWPQSAVHRNTPTVTLPFQPSYPARILLTLPFAALADFLFLDQPAGITLFLFAAMLAAAVTAVHPAALRDRLLPVKAAGLLLALLPLVENVSPLSVSVGLVATAIFALSIAHRLRAGVAGIAGQLAMFFLAAPFRLARDFFRWRKVARRSGSRPVRLAAVAVWAMPLTLGALFLILFGVANPVIEHWLSLIDVWALLEFIQPARLAFWLGVVVAVWAFLRPRLPIFFRRAVRAVASAPAAAPPAIDPKTPATIEAIVFGRGAILRALVVFNLLFALQTGLDAAYLWGGVALPDGMTYAAYAHRGAYPLIATALLAAAFVLAAMRPGSATSNDPVIRGLVYLWVAQNIALVVSSILRLDLYVDFYSLTYWRVAAFIWMGLVAAGLALIITRIALGKSNEWLFSANLLTLSATLYACSFINFAALIADYNVRHSQEMTGQGTPLDTCYLRSLGPSAFPAIDRFVDHFAPHTRFFCGAKIWRSVEEHDFRVRQQNWRAWSFRDRRLIRYLDGRVQHEAAPRLPTGH
jgi:hypothetical protein